ncbi:MAG: hypothetical protein ACXQS8_08770 [Candidatus Helarchaeales archaeon]
MPIAAQLVFITTSCKASALVIFWPENGRKMQEKNIIFVQNTPAIQIFNLKIRAKGARITPLEERARGMTRYRCLNIISLYSAG